MATCQDLIDSINAMSLNLRTGQDNIVTSIDAVTLQLVTANSHLGYIDTDLQNINTSINGISLNIADIFQSLNSIRDCLRDPDSPLSTVWTEFHNLSDALKGTNTINELLVLLKQEINTIGNNLYNTVENKSIAELLYDTNREIDGVENKISSINGTLSAMNVILGVLTINVPAIAASLVTIAGELTGLIAGLGAIATSINLGSTQLSGINSTLLPLSGFFTSILYSVDDFVEKLESIVLDFTCVCDSLKYEYEEGLFKSIAELSNETKESIEDISIDLFQSKDGKTIQVKG